MPKLMNDKEEQLQFSGVGGFHFSAVRMDQLGATEYTLVTIAVDKSGSVESFKDDLINCLKNIVKACQKSPRSDNLMIRVVSFSERLHEIHGFRLLSDIDADNDYKLNCNGMTNLYGATFDTIGSLIEYGNRLVKSDYSCNGISFIITDGLHNVSSEKATPYMISQLIKDGVGQEKVESLTTILIGLHDPGLSWERETKRALEDFRKNAGLTQFVDVGGATPQKLAKLAEFVSKSVSSTSQALGTKAPSQPVTMTF